MEGREGIVKNKDKNKIENKNSFRIVNRILLEFKVKK